MKNDSPAPLFPFISERAYTACLLILTFILVPALLFLGLRAKDWPVENAVQWLPEQQAIRFHSPSMAYVDDLQILQDGRAVEEFTFHFRITVPDLEVKGFRPILTIYSATDEQQLAVWHWGASVIAMNGNDYDYRKRWPRISADDVLKPGVPAVITISSGPSGTKLYVGGSLMRESDQQILAIPDEGQKLRLILGNTVYGKHGWDGDFHSLALFTGELEPGDIQLLQESGVVTDDLKFLYTFHGGQGRIITDDSGQNNPLYIPPRPLVFKRVFLARSWNDVHSRSFWYDALLNFLGFIPLGAVVYSLLRQLKGLQSSYAAGAAVLFGFLLSLTIEMIQVWLPARASSLLDLTLNSTGSIVGISLMYLLLRLRTKGLERR